METITCVSAQTPNPDWRKNFLILCEDICGSEDSRNPFKEFRVHTACPYCGKAFEVQKSDRQKYRMCPDCRRRIIKDQNQLQRLVGETEKNVAHLFGIELKNKLPAKKLARPPQSRNVKKGEPAKVSQPSGFYIAKTKKGQTEVNLWGYLPDAVVAAEIVRYICESHFTEICGEWEGITGAAQWMRVRYLRIMDLEEYAVAAEKKVCQSETGAYGYVYWDPILKHGLSREIPEKVKVERKKVASGTPADDPNCPRSGMPVEKAGSTEPGLAADDLSSGST